MNKLKKTITAGFIVVALSSPVTSYAGGSPIFDAAANALGMDQLVQNEVFHDIKMDWEKKAMELATDLAGLDRDHETSLAAANQARSAEFEATMYNQENMKDRMPIDVCNEVKLAANTAKNECESESYALDSAVVRQEDQAALKQAIDEMIADGTPGPDVARAVKALTTMKADELIDDCSSFLIDDSYDMQSTTPTGQVVQGKIIYQPCTSSGVLAGFVEGKTLSATELEQAERVVDLLLFSGLKEMPPASGRTADNLKYYKRLAYKNFVASNLNDLIGMHRAVEEGQPSIMGALDEYIKSESSSTEAIIDAIEINEGSSVSSIKYTAQAMRVLLRMQNMQIQQNQKIQALMTMDLALQLDGQ
jgi:hypothetical protein